MKDWLIIDGYNLLHQISPGFVKGDIARLTKSLLIRLERLVNVLARRITVVFDGKKEEAPHAQKDQTSPTVLRRPSSRRSGALPCREGRSASPNRERFAQARSEIIEVIYAPSDSTADSVIENLAWKAEHPEDILVVTSDRLERDAVSAGGADTMASSIFISMIKEQTDNLTARLDKINKRHENITLGDIFPEQKTD